MPICLHDFGRFRAFVFHTLLTITKEPYFRAMKSRLLLITLLASFSAFGQTNYLDSIQAKLDDGVLLWLDEEYYDAIFIFTSIIDQVPEADSTSKILSACYSLRGNCKSLLGNPERAIIDYNKSIELNTSESALYWRGRARGASGLDGDWYGAISDFTRAIEEGDEESRWVAKSYFYRGFAKTFLGDIKGGCLDMTKAIDDLGFDMSNYPGAEDIYSDCK